MRIFAVLQVFLAFSVSAQSFDEVLKKGDEYYTAGNYTEAVKYFTQAIGLDNKNVKGYWYRADAYRQNQQYAEGAADYTRALDIEQNNVKFLTRRGDCYYNTNQFQLALRDYTRGIELEKTNATLWLYRGDCYAKLNDTNNACDDYQQAHELGDKSAKSQARKVICDWVTALQKPCPSGEAHIGKIEIDPFTGAIVVSKGLSYHNFNIQIEDTETTITGPVFAIGQSFNFRINKPANFCVNDDDEAFFGIGLKLFDDAGKELANVHNIYQEDQGIIQEALKYLSAKLDFDVPMEVGKNYSMSLRFFDTRGNGEVLMNFPTFKIAPKTQTNSNTLASQSVLGKGVNTGSVGIEPVSLEIKQQGKTELAKNQILARTGVASFTVNTRNSTVVTGYQIKLIDAKGEVAIAQSGKPIVKGNKLRADIVLKNQKPGLYQAWLRFSNEEGEQSLGLVMSITIR